MIEVPLLDAADCARARDTVHELRPNWMARNAMVPFFTLGAASYLDAERTGDASGYYRLAADSNPLLQLHFAWLHEKVTDALAKALEAPVAFKTGFALPGFHVFLKCVVFEQPFAAVHRDLQYRALDWGSSASPDFDEPLSFTLAVSLPTAGAGLYLWDLYEQDLNGKPESEVARLAAASTRAFHAYQIGTLNIHSGHQLHQIAESQYARPEDERITLQGHGIRCGKVWQLYW